MQFDIVIFGGGPAGASAAITLCRLGYSVVIIEKSGYEEQRPGETIPPKTVALLQSLYAGADMLSGNVPSNANVSAWGTAGVNQKNFLADPYGNGWHLDRVLFDRQLVDEAVKAGALLVAESKINEVLQAADRRWHVEISSRGNEYLISGRFALDATGRNSFLVKKLGGRRKNIDNLVALTCWRKSGADPATSNHTLVESVKDGWWYSADLPDGKMILSFMTDTDVLKNENCPVNKVWAKYYNLTRHTKARKLADEELQVTIYAANSYLMSKTSGDNWLAVGDAAMAYDPLSSIGIYKAIKDGLDAAAGINKYLAGNRATLAEISAGYKRRFDRYLETRNAYYQMEKRWPESPFWQKRGRAH